MAWKMDGDEFEFVNHFSHFNPLYLFVTCCMLILYAISITEPAAQVRTFILKLILKDIFKSQFGIENSTNR